ncbi:MAG: hypothetical protein HYY02_08420 [Chloroflexi bacterium]|nr:hypothetical protein [Chloroflexota bacterium]
MLPVGATEPFDSPDWLFELKWGGVRALALIDQGRLTLRGQNGRDITAAYPELQGLPGQLAGHSATLDGDIVALGRRGHPEMELLRPRLTQLLRSPGGQAFRSPVSYEVSDILELDGRLLTDLPLWQRKNILHSHVTPSETAQIAAFIDSEGVAFFDAICQHGLDGMIAKQKYSPYRPGRRSRDWLEVRAQEVGHYVIGGYTFGGGNKQEAFQRLLLGAYRGPELVYVGLATAGLSRPEAWTTVRLLEELHTPQCPFSTPPAVNRLSYWCQPKLVCQVRLGERSGSGALRFAVFVSLRPDLAAQDCRLEVDDPLEGA